MKSSFNIAISPIPKEMDLQRQRHVHRLGFGKELFTYIYAYILVRIYEELFLNVISKLGIGIANSTFGIGAEHIFEKSSSYIEHHIYICICVYVHICIYECIHKHDVICIWSTHFRNLIKRHLKKWVSNVNANFRDHVLGKSSS